MAADDRDLRIRCIARKRSAFAPIRTTLLSGPTARSAQETPAIACVPSYEAPGTLRDTAVNLGAVAEAAHGGALRAVQKAQLSLLAGAPPGSRVPPLFRLCSESCIACVRGYLCSLRCVLRGCSN